jgi:hypothetical protein
MKSILSRKRLLFFLTLLMPATAGADQFTQGTFQISNAELENQYEFIAEYPVSKKTDSPIVWPDSCMSAQSNLYQLNDVIIQTYLVNCGSPLMSGDTITLPYRVDAAIFELHLGSWQSRSIASNSEAGVELVLQTDDEVIKTLYDIAAEYLLQGITHIWLGWDHLAFVFCLCLLTTGIRILFWSVSAFTIGHSVSMAMSFFGVVTIPVPPIEAIIALSIVLIAREAWFQVNPLKQLNKAFTASRLRMLTIIVIFGLIHGLGFASALENIGVLPKERIPALIFFNIGVEIGQVSFVVIISIIIALLHKIKKDQVFTYISLVCVGSAGSFWLVERVSSFS